MLNSLIFKSVKYAPEWCSNFETPRGCKKIDEFICFSNQYSRRIPFEIWRWQLLQFFDRKSRKFRVVLTWCLQNSRNRQICPRLLRNAFLSRRLSCFCCHFGCGFSSLIIHNYKSHFRISYYLLTKKFSTSSLFVLKAMLFYCSYFRAVSAMIWQPQNISYAMAAAT